MYVYGIDSATGAGDGVAYGTGSTAPKAENVAIGKNATIGYSNGTSAATGDIVIGNKANINNYASQGGSIAMGDNAKIENMAGGGEASFAFGQTTYSGNFLSSARIPADPTKAPGSIAIGQNTFARTGSTMIGVHNYAGALGDTTVDSASTRKDNLNVYATTLGANSNSNGAFTTLTGAYSIISSNYDGGRFANPIKNLGATITGSLNSIESYSSGYYSGIANSITGIANRTNNANGALIYGAGNTISNSITSLSGAPTDSGSSAKAFQDSLINMIKNNNGGGSTLAFGGGNTANYTLRSALIGVNNTLTGVSGNESTNNLVVGYKNTGTNIDGTTIIGSNRTASNATNSIIMGTATTGTNTTASNAVVLGTDANVTVDGGIALGSNSISNRGPNVGGYNMATKSNNYTDGSSTWNATAGAVSVGDVSKNITRQITNVAAGSQDTDAVNVAQLKTAIAGATTTIVDGSTTTVTGNNNNYKIEVNPTTFAGDIGSAPAIKPGETLKITGGNVSGLTNNNIGVVGDQNQKSLSIKLADTLTGLKDVQTTNITANTGNINTITSNSITVGNKINISSTGIDAGNTSIKNIADGINPMDAVNKKQLDSSISKVNYDINKIAAGASALAGLHPLDFDPDSKFNVAVSGGFYKNEHALAIGAFYHPNEETMFSVASTVGNNDNMVNVGASFKFGGAGIDRKFKEQYKTAPISTVYVLEKQIISLQNQLIAQKEKDEERITKLENLVAELTKR